MASPKGISSTRETVTPPSTISINKPRNISRMKTTWRMTWRTNIMKTLIRLIHVFFSR